MTKTVSVSYRFDLPQERDAALFFKAANPDYTYFETKRNMRFIKTLMREEKECGIEGT